MRRRTDKPIPLELDILRVARSLADDGTLEFHGHLLASRLADKYDSRKLVGYGTLYKALDRLERHGFLESEWEDPNIAAEHCRPRRRLYSLRKQRIAQEPIDLVTAIIDERVNP